MVAGVLRGAAKPPNTENIYMNCNKCRPWRGPPEKLVAKPTDMKQKRLWQADKQQLDIANAKRLVICSQK